MEEGWVGWGGGGGSVKLNLPHKNLPSKILALFGSYTMIESFLPNEVFSAQHISI